MTTILDGQPNLSIPNLAFGLPDRTRRVAKAGLIVLAIGITLLVAVMRSAPLGIQAFFFILALLCGFIAFTPQLLYGSSIFQADRQGIYFPHHSKRRLLEWNHRDQWLLVPWDKVAKFQLASVFAGEQGFRPGVELFIDVAPNQEEEFFSHLQSPFFRNREANQLLKVCYISSFNSPNEVIDKLQLLIRFL